MNQPFTLTIPRAGIESYELDFAELPTGSVVEIQIAGAGAWWPLAFGPTDDSRIAMLAGPDVVDTMGAIPVGAGGSWTWRSDVGEQILYRPGGTIYITDAAGDIDLGSCVPATTDWGCLSAADYAVLTNPDNVLAKARSLALAWTSLQSLTGYRLDICPVTVRPCSAACGASWFGSYDEADSSGTGFFRPGINNQGYWVNGCGCAGECNCGPALEIVRLPGPIGRVAEVTVNGVTRAPGTYRVDNGNQLISLTTPWPTCQDMSAGLTEDDTFGVTYYRGFGPDALTNFAAGVLAWEFFKACTGGKNCRLPSGVTSITRSGVTMEIQPGLWPDGHTGIREVDAVIHTLNPNGLKQPVQIVTPESMAGEPRRSSWVTG